MNQNGHRELTYLEAVREALILEMRQDPEVFIIGEDVGLFGGVFGVTAGLYEEFGEARVRDTPISEQAIVGAGRFIFMPLAVKH